MADKQSIMELEDVLSSEGLIAEKNIIMEGYDGPIYPIVNYNLDNGFSIRLYGVMPSGVGMDTAEQDAYKGATAYSPVFSAKGVMTDIADRIIKELDGTLLKADLNNDEYHFIRSKLHPQEIIESLNRLHSAHNEYQRVQEGLYAFLEGFRKP